MSRKKAWRRTPSFTSAGDGTTTHMGAAPSSPPQFRLQYGSLLQYVCEWTGFGRSMEGEWGGSAVPLPAATAAVQQPTVNKVNFSTSVKVVLIPCLTEFREAGLSNDVWWDNEVDFGAFKRSACLELQQIMVEVRVRVVACLACPPTPPPPPSTLHLPPSTLRPGPTHAPAQPDVPPRGDAAAVPAHRRRPRVRHYSAAVAVLVLLAGRGRGRYRCRRRRGGVQALFAARAAGRGRG